MCPVQEPWLAVPKQMALFMKQHYKVDHRNFQWDIAAIQGRFPLENICMFSSPSKEDAGKDGRNYLLSLWSAGDRFLIYLFYSVSSKTAPEKCSAQVWYRDCSSTPEGSFNQELKKYLCDKLRRGRHFVQGREQAEDFGGSMGKTGAFGAQRNCQINPLLTYFCESQQIVSVLPVYLLRRFSIWICWIFLKTNIAWYFSSTSLKLRKA